MAARNLNAPENWYHWLKACLKDGAPVELGKHSLGMLTGQDKRCLSAIAACWHLYAASDDDGRRAALEAIRALLPGMQSKCWMFARELIPQAMDWHTRAQLWPRVVPPELESGEPPPGWGPAMTRGALERHALARALPPCNCGEVGPVECEQHGPRE